MRRREIFEELLQAIVCRVKIALMITTLQLKKNNKNATSESERRLIKNIVKGESGSERPHSRSLGIRLKRYDRNCNASSKIIPLGKTKSISRKVHQF